MLVKSLAKANSEILSLKCLLARFKSEATKLRASLIDAEVSNRVEGKDD